MQTNIFGEIETYEITIKQAAKIAHVSTATIRNWIKTGYLIQSGKGYISQDSLEKFIKQVAGKEKLNSRANKLLKDEHDHQEVSNKVSELITKFKGEKIGFEYESLLSESHRNKEGIYYTPSWIVADLFKNIKINHNFKFLDPCCGSGNFLIEAIKQGVSPENVFGFDTDENAVLIAKQRIKDEFGYDTNNVKVADFLEVAIKMKNNNHLFDLIFTNPPWGKKIAKSEKEKYSILYDCGDSIDTTSLFLGASLSILKSNGILGFLIQEAFFNISTFEYIRRKVLSKKILRFVDYGKPFKNLVTKAQGIVIENKASNPQDFIECCVNNNVYIRSIKSFLDNPKQIFNFWINEEEAEIINHLFSIKHITLKNKAIWGLGIVTGNNKKYCINEPVDGYIPVYKGSDITKLGLKVPDTFILNDFSKFQQVAPFDLYNAKEKIIYKFISSDLCFYCDTEQRFILNSANFFIPYNIGITAEQLTTLLNSEIINWLFKKLFSTHKILRGDLELLPIHIEYFKFYNDFSEEHYLNYLQLSKTNNSTYRIKK